MKIVYLNSIGHVGGAERVLLDLLASMRAAEPSWSLHLVAPEEGALAESARELGVGVSVLPLPRSLARLGDAAAGGPAGRGVSRAALALKLLSSSAATALYVRRLRLVLRELAPDLVHTNGLKTHVLGAWAACRMAPVVWHVHDYAGRRPLMSRLLRASARRAAAAVANSRSVAEDLRGVVGAKMKVHTVYNAVDLERFKPEGDVADLDALAGLAPADAGTLRVGLVATYSRWKGHRTFLEALSLLPRDARVRGYVVGGALYQTDGSQHTLEELRRAARELGIAERVGFTGHVREAASAMRALDVVVHASTEPEPFGLVIAEAMACGRAVVASRAGGAAEIIEAGEGALSHTPGDAAALAAGIMRLANDADLLALLGRAGRAAAERLFDRTRLAADWTPIYRRLRNAECGLETAGFLSTTSASSTTSATTEDDRSLFIDNSTALINIEDSTALVNHESAIRNPQPTIEASAIEASAVSNS